MKISYSSFILTKNGNNVEKVLPATEIRAQQSKGMHPLWKTFLF